MENGDLCNILAKSNEIVVEKSPNPSGEGVSSTSGIFEIPGYIDFIAS